jgi:enoyl-CoA hydratase/carnithine racemase
MFLSERIDARRAETLGLVNRIVRDIELREAAFTLANSLADGPAVAYAYMKDNLDHASTSGFFEALDHEAENMVRTAQTREHKEGLRAFVEKRRLSFNGH